MRVIENTANRLVLRHSPWVTSGLCWMAIIGMAVRWPGHLLSLEIPELPIATIGIAMSAGMAWWLGRWTEFTFERGAGTLEIRDRWIPFSNIGSRHAVLPLDAITDVKLQSIYDDTWMWRAAIIADPAKLPQPPQNVAQRRQWLRRHHFVIDADGEFPFVPYYTANEQEWTGIRDAARRWLGVHVPATRTGTNVR